MCGLTYAGRSQLVGDIDSGGKLFNADLYSTHAKKHAHTYSHTHPIDCLLKSFREYITSQMHRPMMMTMMMMMMNEFTLMWRKS